MSRIALISVLLSITTACLGGDTSIVQQADNDTGATDAGTEDTSTTDTGLDTADPGTDADTDSEEDTDTQIVWFESDYSVPGEYALVVPANVEWMTVELWGGGGGGGNQFGATGGGAAFVSADVPVFPGETLDIWVAEHGAAATSCAMAFR
jgi:hypothetical protein